jgi:magnesium chelatase family protein
LGAHGCKCGHALSDDGRCQCSAADIDRYRARLSGPLADRLDLWVHVGVVEVAALGAARRAESSAEVRTRVIAARDRQRMRYASVGGARSNAEAAGRWLVAHGGLTADARAMLQQAVERLGISARGFHRAVRVARTIADLAGCDEVGPDAVAEAIGYRPPPRASGS